MPPIFYAPDTSEACRYIGCNHSRYANGFCRDHYIECMKARHWDEWPRSPKGDTSDMGAGLSDPVSEP